MRGSTTERVNHSTHRTLLRRIQKWLPQVKTSREGMTATRPLRSVLVEPDTRTHEPARNVDSGILTRAVRNDIDVERTHDASLGRRL